MAPGMEITELPHGPSWVGPTFDPQMRDRMEQIAEKLLGLCERLEGRIADLEHRMADAEDRMTQEPR